MINNLRDTIKYLKGSFLEARGQDQTFLFYEGLHQKETKYLGTSSKHI